MDAGRAWGQDGDEGDGFGGFFEPSSSSATLASGTASSASVSASEREAARVADPSASAAWARVAELERELAFVRQGRHRSIHHL
jgi:hypothetical protein